VTVIMHVAVDTLAITVTSFPTCHLPVTLLCDTIKSEIPKLLLNKLQVNNDYNMAAL